MMTNKLSPRRTTSTATQWLGWGFPLLILVMVSALLTWNAYVRYSEFQRYQYQLMESSVNGTAAEIGIFIGELRRSVHLFADTEHVLLDKLAVDPTDQQLLEKISAAVHKHFPDSFAFTTADNQGKPLIDDFDGLVGEVCMNDMRTFAMQKSHSKVYIHPNPITYHFDIMVDREHNGDSTGIFFVSFTTDILSSTLAHGEAPGHKLLLLKQDIPGLIEVASGGVRIKLQREFKLSTQEMARIGYSTPISGTSWELVDLPDKDLYADTLSDIQREAALIMLAFLAVNGSMLWMLYRSQVMRRRIEHLYHHDAVTGLPNRYLFFERFAHMTTASSASGTGFALLLIDLGQFRRPKGTFFEHRSDDALIKSVAERIEKTLHDAGFIAKIGDSDFAVLIQEQNPKQIDNISTAILDALKKPFGLSNDIVLPNPCFGSAFYPDDGGDVNMLIRHAGTKIYAARMQYKNNFFQ